MPLLVLVFSFEATDIHYASFDLDSFIVLPEGFNWMFSENYQNWYPPIKLSLNAFFVDWKFQQLKLLDYPTSNKTFSCTGNLNHFKPATWLTIIGRHPVFRDANMFVGVRVHIVNDDLKDSLTSHSNLWKLIGTAVIDVTWQSQTSPHSISREQEKEDWVWCSSLLNYWRCPGPMSDNSGQGECLYLLSTLYKRPYVLIRSRY